MSSQNKNLIFNLVLNNYNNPIKYIQKRKLINKSESDDSWWDDDGSLLMDLYAERGDNK